jgi:hypothetical protein
LALSKVVARTSVRSRIDERRFLTPSDRIDREMNRAAAASVHHQPIPIPATPTNELRAVIQSALFILASA